MGAGTAHFAALSEAWLTFKDWIDRDNPRFAFSVARNIILGSMIPESERGWAQLVRREARGRMRYLLPEGTILCLPTTPFPAPKRGEPLSVAGAQRGGLLCLCCHGGLTGMLTCGTPVSPPWQQRHNRPSRCAPATESGSPRLGAGKGVVGKQRIVPSGSR